MTWRQQAASDGPWSRPDARTSPASGVGRLGRSRRDGHPAGLDMPAWLVGIAASISRSLRPRTTNLTGLLHTRVG